MVIVGGAAALCAGLLCLLLFLPALVLTGSGTSAQEQAGPGPPAGGAAEEPEEATQGTDVTTQPIRDSRSNPFQPGIVYVDGKRIDYSKVQSFLPDFSGLPLTVRVPFPTVPGPVPGGRVPPPDMRPPPGLPGIEEPAVEEIEDFPPLRLSSVAGAGDRVQATLEPLVEGYEPRIVKLGDTVGDWVVHEISKDGNYVVFQHRTHPDETRRFDMQSEEQAPVIRGQPRTQPGGGMPGMMMEGGGAAGGLRTAPGGAAGQGGAPRVPGRR
jgi:hypothetical protein